MRAWHVIVLAGGRGSRMGGVSKGEVMLDGGRLVDRLLQHLLSTAGSDAATMPAEDAEAQQVSIGRVSVVSPSPIPGLPAWVVQTSERPPYGGPTAGVEAAFRVAGPQLTRTAVLAVDAPRSPLALPQLSLTLDGAPDADVCAVTSIGDDGAPWVEPLCALWKTESLAKALTAIGDTRNRSAFSLLRKAQIVTVPGQGFQRDFDTLAELATVGRVTLPEAE